MGHLSKRAKQVEKILNTIRLEPNLGLGELVGVYLDLSWRKPQSPFYTIIWSLRQLISPSKARIQIQYWNSQNKEPVKKVLICCVSSSNRYLDFFRAYEHFDDILCWIVCGGNKTIETKSIGSSLSIEKDALPSAQRKQLWRLEELSWLEKLQIQAVSTLQYRRYLAARQWLLAQQIQTVISDYDRYPANAYWVLAARSLRTPTVSLVHGATNPIDHYVPVLADQLWVWGEYQQKQFYKYHGSELNVKIVGNSKVPQFRTREKRAWKTVGLGMTHLSKPERDKLIQLFLEGTTSFKNKIIKIHPQEDISDYQGYQETGIHIIGGEGSTSDFFEAIDCLCVRRSQLGSDALSYGIPIIICDGINSHDLQNGEVLHSQAGCPVVQNSRELENEISKLRLNWDYLQMRLQQQKAYFKLLYEYTGQNANQRLISQLKHSITPSLS